MRNRSDQRKFHFIYKVVCTLNRKYYLGMHSTDDMDDGYMGSGRWVRRSIKKHGFGAHSREIVEQCASRELLRQRERELVDEDVIKDPLCMNFAVGGGSAPIGNRFAVGPRTDEQKWRIAEGCRRGWAALSPERRSEIAQMKIGKQHSIEAKEKISVALRARERKPETGKKIAEAIRNQPQSYRDKLSEIAKKRKLSSETREKIAQANRIRIVSDETRRKMSESQKKRRMKVVSLESKPWLKKLLNANSSSPAI